MRSYLGTLKSLGKILAVVALSFVPAQIGSADYITIDPATSTLAPLQSMTLNIDFHDTTVGGALVAADSFVITNNPVDLILSDFQKGTLFFSDQGPPTVNATDPSHYRIVESGVNGVQVNDGDVVTLLSFTVTAQAGFTGSSSLAFLAQYGSSTTEVDDLNLGGSIPLSGPDAGQNGMIGATINSSVPEPSAMIQCGLGLAGIIGYRLLRRRVS
jgi:hypothetical protein